MKNHQHIYPSPEAVAEAFAAHFQEWASEKELFTVALSGGSTPQLLFQHLATHYCTAIDWEKVHFFWGDERCVPPEHPDSNYKMAFDNLLQHIDIPAENIHRIWGEAEPILEAERYAAEILTHVPAKNSWPAFDLIMLGLGEDGHTASIFPNQMELLNSTKICAVASHPETGQQRITLTGKVINNAAVAAFLVTGANKQPALRVLIEKSDGWERFPAARVGEAAGVCWFLDRAAAP